MVFLVVQDVQITGDYFVFQLRTFGDAYLLSMIRYNYNRSLKKRTRQKIPGIQFI